MKNYCLLVVLMVFSVPSLSYGKESLKCSRSEDGVVSFEISKGYVKGKNYKWQLHLNGDATKEKMGVRYGKGWEKAENQFEGR